MKSSARVQAALDILQALRAGNLAADRALVTWGREHRFAGSGDRRAIADLVYAVLRTGDAGAPRRAMLTMLRNRGDDPADIDALFDGSRHGPALLSPDERAILSGDAASQDDPLAGPLRRVFSNSLNDELGALTSRAPLDLRVNPLKCDFAAAVERLAEDGLIVEVLDLVPGALRVTSGAARLQQSAAFIEGLVEIQDAGSQAVSRLCDARAGHNVLDLCAGAGGKTLAMAGDMGNEGSILACDIAAIRLDRLAPRLERAGVTIASTRQLAPDWVQAGRGPGGLYDRVVVDAPCSGSGTWRRNPETRSRTTPETLARLAALQRDLLGAASSHVRPGGRLVYITCSVFMEEGEDVVEAFLSAHPDFRPIPAAQIYADVTGRPAPAGIEQIARLTPARHNSDGFFAAIFNRS